MRPNIVLVDFESVQPTCFGRLSPDYFRVKVFVGATQSRLSFELVTAIQQIGDRAEYIKIAGVGRNALDFLEAPGVLARFLDHPVFPLIMLPTRTGFRVLSLASQPILRAIGRVVGCRIIVRVSPVATPPENTCAVSAMGAFRFAFRVRVKSCPR